MKRQLVTALVVIAVATLLVYGRVVTFDFVDYDDYQYVTRNPEVISGLTFESFRWAWTSFYGSNWHPLTWLSHMLDVELFGLAPWGHHLTSLLLHTLNAFLLLLILARLTGSSGKSFLVALLFALHPLHVESVAYVAERKDVLSTFLWLLTMAAYLRYVAKPKVSTYLLVVLSLAAGLLAKPMLVTLPFVLLLLDVWPLGRLAPGRSDGMTTRPISPLRAVGEKVPFFLLAVASAVVTYRAQAEGGSVATVNGTSFLVQCGNAFISYVRYIEQTFWPQDLAVFYPLDPAAVTPAGAGGAAAVLCLVTWVAIKKGMRYPYLPVGWLWYVGTLVPVIGLVRVGMQARADRYTYIPLIGIFIILVWGGDDLCRRFKMRRKVMAAGVAVALIAMAAVTWRQVGYWQNSFTLFGHAVEVSDGNWLAHHNLGTACINAGRYDDALHHLREALRIRPDYPSAYSNIGNVYLSLEQPLQAIASYREALSHNPDFIPARRNLVRAYLRLGDSTAAYGEYLILRDIAPYEAQKVWPPSRAAAQP